VAVLILLLLGVGTAATRLRTYHEPLERDITSYAVVADKLLEGHHLYTQMWDIKPPATFVTYALALRVVPDRVLAIYLLGVAAAVAAMLGAYQAGCALVGGGRAAGLWSAALWSLSCGDLSVQGNQPNAEAFMNVCLVWCAAAALRAVDRPLRAWQILFWGAVAGWGTLYKQVLIAPLALVAVAAAACRVGRASQRQASRDMLLASAALTSVWGLTFGYFACQGRLRNFCLACFVSSRHYAGSITENLLGILTEGGAAWMALLEPFWPLVALSLVGAWTSIAARRLQTWSVWLAWLVGTAIAWAMPGKLFGHYHQLWLPVLSVGAGAGVVQVADLGTPLTSRAWRFVAQTLGIAALLLLGVQRTMQLALAPDQWSRSKYGPAAELFIQSRDDAGFINGLLEPAESFYNWGSETGLYFYANRPPPTAVLFHRQLLGGPAARRLTRQTLAELEAASPELVVMSNRLSVPRLSRHPVPTWIKERYLPITGARRGEFTYLSLRGGGLEARLATRATSATAP
jgi:hypothetical protein